MFVFQTVHMTKAITAAFREMLSEADWMEQETRRLAARKLDAMQLRIGYPDFIVDPDKLDERYDAVSICTASANSERKSQHALLC